MKTQENYCHMYKGIVETGKPAKGMTMWKGPYKLYTSYKFNQADAMSWVVSMYKSAELSGRGVMDSNVKKVRMRRNYRVEVVELDYAGNPVRVAWAAYEGVNEKKAKEQMEKWNDSTRKQNFAFPVCVRINKIWKEA